MTEMMTFNCKNMTTNMGMNKSDSIDMNHTESVGMMKSLSVGMDFITNVIGKMVKYIKGNYENHVEKDKTTAIHGKGNSQSVGNHEFHSQKDIHHNSAEKSKSH